MPDIMVWPDSTLNIALWVKYKMTDRLFYPFNPLTAKLFNLNFHPLGVVFRWRDPQFQVN